MVAAVVSDPAIRNSFMLSRAYNTFKTLKLKFKYIKKRIFRLNIPPFLYKDYLIHISGLKTRISQHLTRIQFDTYRQERHEIFISTTCTCTHVKHCETYELLSVKSKLDLLKTTRFVELIHKSLLHRFVFLLQCIRQNFAGKIFEIRARL